MARRSSAEIRREPAGAGRMPGALGWVLVPATFLLAETFLPTGFWAAAFFVTVFFVAVFFVAVFFAPAVLLTGAVPEFAAFAAVFLVVFLVLLAIYYISTLNTHRRFPVSGTEQGSSQSDPVPDCLEFVPAWRTAIASGCTELVLIAGRC